MKLAIGFLTYSKLTARYLPDFLASLELALNFLSPSQHQITVFDNSESGDKQNQQIIESFNRGELGFSPHSPIQYLTQEKNLGFSRAYNILIRYNPVLQLGSLNLRISDFNWDGNSSPFEGNGIRPVVDGVIRGR